MNIENLPLGGGDKNQRTGLIKSTLITAFKTTIKSHNIPHIISIDESKNKVDILVYQYHEYMELSGKIKNIKDQGNESDNIEIIKLQAQQIALGESMKYHNPFIWLEYKRIAYQNSPSKIETLYNLRDHCKDPTYICSKRLDFLNNELKMNFGIDLFDDNKIPGDTLLTDLLDPQNFIWKLCNDANFMSQWQYYEYYMIGDKTAKWENYSNSNKSNTGLGVGFSSDASF